MPAISLDPSVDPFLKCSRRRANDEHVPYKGSVLDAKVHELDKVRDFWGDVPVQPDDVGPAGVSRG